MNFPKTELLHMNCVAIMGAMDARFFVSMNAPLLAIEIERE